MHAVEIYLTESLEPRVRDNYHTVLVAKNIDGLRELNKLVQLSSERDHFYYKNRITFDEFLNISDNIITTSACLASPLNQLPMDHPRYMELVQKYDFLEIQPHNHPEQIAFNRRLLALSKRFHKPLIAGTDTHSSSDYKAECRAALLLAKGQSYGNEDSFDLSYKTYDELVQMFAVQNAIPEEEYLQAIENTNLLCDMTEELELDTSIKYPILYGSREADSQKFTETVERKFRQKLREGIIPPKQEQAFRQAIDEEMAVFRELQMDGFMLSMSELVCWCRDQGMAIGTARGSVGGSRVAYVTDIIDLNPETWHTVFSRFANPTRVEIGDIDIDCVESDRPAIFQHIVDRFGSDKTARVASFGTIQAKGVIDEIGRYLSRKWEQDNPGCGGNPWTLEKIAEIKREITGADEASKKDKQPITSYPEFQAAAKKYPELFYYFDGLFNTKISQSVHPAGMVISPITLNDNIGFFNKDGENCLLLDMDNIHDYTGLAKYDFLVLKTVQVIRDTCQYLGKPYPRTHEIDWEDQNVWNDMTKSPACLFQFESEFAFSCLKKFAPKSIFDLSIVAACIRPSGASYRDELLDRIPHKNPSPLLDDLLKDNLGYLIYQEDTIKFLQQICGLSGGEADNVRRAIGRKQKDRLDKAMPSILEGYCARSEKPREDAEREAKEFLQVIEDSASYQFGENHSIAYCLLGYLCAYFRYYHPLEFLTAFLNNAANEDDVRHGTEFANLVGINVILPRWGMSRDDYFYDRQKNVIAKGVSSVKFMGNGVGEMLYQLANEKHCERFVDVLMAIRDLPINTRQLEILIKLDFFMDFGNQRELLRIMEIFYDMFKRGDAKKISREKVSGTPLDEIVARYSIGKTKNGSESKVYTLLNVPAILREAEDAILALNIEDIDVIRKAQYFAEMMGYDGYVSYRETDRRKLYVKEVYPLVSRKSNRKFGYALRTKSIGSGVEAKWTVPTKVYSKNPVQKGDVIQCTSWGREGKYFRMNGYNQIG